MLVILGIAFSAAHAQGIDFFEGSWEEALELAQKEEKLIFVDCYAVWCGPCRRMAANVFPDPKAGDFFNANFINLKWDMERGKGLEFRKKYPVSAFPTLYFIDPQGEVVISARGARDVPGLIALGEQALAKFNPHADFSNLYAEGDRSSETVFHHLNNLKRQGENIRPLANDYFRSGVDFSDENNLRLLTVVVDEADSRLFDLLVEHKQAVVDLYGEERYNEIVLQAGWNTISKAMDFREPFLIDEASRKLLSANHPEAESFEQRSRVYYSIRVRDESMYRTNMDRFLRINAAELPDAAIELMDLGQRFFGKSPDFADNLVSPWGVLAGNSDHPEIHFRHAGLLQKTGNQRQARRAIERAISLAGEDEELIEKYEEFQKSL